MVYRDLHGKTLHKKFTTLPLELCDSAFGVWVELSSFTLEFLTAVAAKTQINLTHMCEELLMITSIVKIVAIICQPLPKGNALRVQPSMSIGSFT